MGELNTTDWQSSTACLNDAVSAPRPFDVARGAEAEAAVAVISPAFQQLLVGVGGCSPFLHDLILREADWLQDIADQPLGSVMQSVLAAITVPVGDRDTLMHRLRLAKRRAALLIGLADIGGLWSLGQVTGALTALADGCLEASVAHLIGAEVAKGKLPGVDPARPVETSGYVLFAMGKHGAGELNYSSDIDLVVLFDQDRYDPADYGAVKDRLIRVTRDLVKVMSELTADGYVFRTDLALRPDPGSTPVCMAMEAAERYYEAVGRTWERAAWIKARPCAGDKAAGEKFLKALTPFIWRRHLDFAAIEDTYDMLRRIRAYRGHDKIAVAGHDLKLGAGGIREIEFSAQTRQLILGGREPRLRQRQTLATLHDLVATGWLTEEARAELEAAYVFHRTIEHRLQMIDDAQTHSIPAGGEALARVACFCGYADVPSFEAAVRARLELVQRNTHKFFETETRRSETNLSPQSETLADELRALGFPEGEGAADTLRRWFSGRLPATRSPRARARFEKLLPGLMARLGRAREPMAALAQFDRFLSNLPAGVQIFSLFDSTPQLLDLLTEICESAPKLADYLGRNAGVLDAVLDRQFFAPLPDAASLLAEVQARVMADADYETRLNILRRWAKERRFQLGVQLLRGLVVAEEAARGFSDIADTVLRCLLPVVVETLTPRHGPPPGKGLAIIAMGKLGSREMTAASDIDMIVLYDPDGAEASAGPRPLPVSQYYMRLTQALVNALTAPTSEGVLYEVDMRLRPSGRKGPLATQISGFRQYQANEAWTWEHMALTRARVVAGDPAVMADATQAIDEVLTLPRDPAKLRADALDMRRRVNEAHGAEVANRWGVKLSRGGLMDIEFVAQTAVLCGAGGGAGGTAGALRRAARVGLLAKADAQVLTDALRFQAGLQHLMRVALEGDFDPTQSGEGFMKILLTRMDQPDFAALDARLQALQAQVGDIFDRWFGA